MRHDQVTEPLRDLISSIRDEVVQIALKAARSKLPTKKNSEVLYKAHPEEGFDCSGFVVWVLKQAYEKHHVTFDKQDLLHTNDLVDRFGVLIQWEARQPGDIIAFSYNGYRPSHVGIIVSPVEYVHASPSKHDKVIKASYQQSDVTLKPGHQQIYYRNPIAIKRLALSVNDWMLL